ncbi:HAD family hydrolase [Pseudohaliea rubra]|uniref:Protein Similar to phosphoglycolate phosphatase n=1 Tax=Pseudohaliea rubra DSM 19751 TaxID=1265313 RepID=A0A095X378_9GAMM|nr:HAD-IA family hydrolase [Pseudohaliea rubra]KGE05339.1 protein Similar to phosphoglycolate phosphatase [Pseudohaliea rubra DSM 19751]
MNHPGRRLAAVFFDLDGTLADTAGDFIPVVQTLRAEAGLAPLPPERIRASVSNGARGLVTLALGLGEDDDGFERWRQRLLTLYGGLLGTHATVFPGLRELIAQLDSAGIAWGIATNKPRAYTAPLLERLAIDPPPASVVCPEDVRERKPHPESLERNCREAGCSPAQAIYVGDHRRDIEAGQRAGLYTVAAAYGYIEPGDDPARWGADGLVSNSEALAAQLLPPLEDTVEGLS